MQTHMQCVARISLPRAADASADITNDPTATGSANTPSQKPDAPTQPPSPDMKDVLDEEQRLEEEAQAHLLITRQHFDLANEERSEIMREQDALRDMLMAELKNEDAYLKKWIELI